MFWAYIWQGMPSYPSSQGGTRDETRVEEWRKPIRRRRPWLFWMGAEGWLRHRLIEKTIGIIFVPAFL
jgi:hypothetical protein